jgi:hypothetical protein
MIEVVYVKKGFLNMGYLRTDPWTCSNGYGFLSIIQI